MKLPEVNYKVLQSLFRIKVTELFTEEKTLQFLVLCVSLSSLEISQGDLVTIFQLFKNVISFHLSSWDHHNYFYFMDGKTKASGIHERLAGGLNMSKICEQVPFGSKCCTLSNKNT